MAILHYKRDVCLFKSMEIYIMFTPVIMWRAMTVKSKFQCDINIVRRIFQLLCKFVTSTLNMCS